MVPTGCNFSSMKLYYRIFSDYKNMKNDGEILGNYIQQIMDLYLFPFFLDDIFGRNIDQLDRETPR